MEVLPNSEVINFPGSAGMEVLARGLDTLKDDLVIDLDLEAWCKHSVISQGESQQALLQITNNTASLLNDASHWVNDNIT